MCNLIPLVGKKLHTFTHLTALKADTIRHFPLKKKDQFIFDKGICVIIYMEISEFQRTRFSMFELAASNEIW